MELFLPGRVRIPTYPLGCLYRCIDTRTAVRLSVALRPSRKGKYALGDSRELRFILGRNVHEKAYENEVTRVPGVHFFLPVRREREGGGVSVCASSFLSSVLLSLSLSL